jgi:hypothetical protein
VANYQRFTNKEGEGEGRMKVQNMLVVRASISFPSAPYETLEDIAKQQKPSLAWVVRYAAEKYVADHAAEACRQGHQ